MSKILLGGVTGKRAGASSFWPRSCGVGLTFIAAFGIAACAAAPGQENHGEELGSAAQAITVSGPALFVVGNATLGPGDLALSQRLSGLGLTVTVKTAAAVTTADATGKLVVISESVTSTDVNTKFRTTASPVLVMENALFDDLAMTGTATTEYGVAANQTSVLVFGTPGTLVGDVTVPVTSSAKSFSWGRPGANAKRVAALASDSSASTIFNYEKGASMVGLVAPGRRVGWFATADAATSFNTSAWNLFDSSVSWAATPPVGCSGGCPAKPNTTSTCSDSSCVYACTGKTLSCSTPAQPACGSWNFESSTTEGWSVNPTVVDNAATGSLRVEAPPGGGAAYGTRSLALNVDGTTGKGNAQISVDFCASQATGVQGAFHVMVWFKPTDGGGGLGGPGYTNLNDGYGNSVSGIDVNVPAGVWFDAPSRNVLGANVKHADVTIGGIEGRRGVLYFDNIRFD